MVELRAGCERDRICPEGDLWAAQCDDARRPARFAERLHESLYQIDRRELAEVSVTLANGVQLPQTSDHFLYARCACILAGEEVYDEVLNSGVGFDRFVAPFVPLALLLVLPASCSYYIANYNNRLPTPLDGTWDVTAGAFQPEGLPGPVERVYFEHNRAYQVVLRSEHTWRRHHFEVDPAASTITIWRTWLSKGEQLLSGRYVLTGDRLAITATDTTSGRPLLWELRKRATSEIGSSEN
ncbi:DUF4240 domain-containing protein [Herbidospora sp. NEAU-GS84]|uniref:DUF4240 domain-containing protein n=1 Tax=Herbidospora solisilvae TaxID=2696284 RepID=A0A7C9N0G6_9ACTN|nr:DUF4240 domain-containing protein [Herbidospora solisilvae]NAS22189.1 DUF4240 domain-containing protein [Herbidospora solisilvae]